MLKAVMVTNTTPKATPLAHADFARRAEEIISHIHQLRSELGLGEALTHTWERYVEGESDPELRRFSEVVADARRQAMLQRRLDADREQLHHGHLTHEQRRETGHHYEVLRREVCIYNHLVRGVIEHHWENFHRDELTDWLSRASQGVHVWAVAEITGSISEIALHVALTGLPELRDVRYATVEEDLRGFDFAAEWQGRPVTIDAKTGFYPPLTLSKRGHLHLEISVPREAVADFRVTRRGLDAVRHEVRQALHTAVGPAVHASHRHYS
jgi:AraC-like DNA-binding protein